MNAPAITLTGVGKDYGGRRVLADAELTVAGGELLGLIGPNGAGKSTLLRLLVGLVPPSRGRIDVLGHDPRRDSLAIRRRTSYLPGETGVYQQLTGAQFLRFCAGFHARQQPALRERLLAGFALPLHQKVRSYSAGMKQKLALVATLVPDVDLYLLDEPDRALDASVRFFLRDVLLDLKRAGKTIVLSSHHLSEVETLADRLEFLLDGRFVDAARLAAARAALRRRPRIALRPGVELPPGARLVHRDPDGTLVVETDGEPLAWLRTVPVAAIGSAEIGTTRLEDLYELLLHGDAGGRP
jgi:ABC-2 type transport system ATP-binding protein